MSEDVKTIPAKVADLIEKTERLDHDTEGHKMRLASLELKAATAGKLGWMDFVKIGSFVCAISGGVSWIGQTFVRAEMAEALMELKVKQARTETAVEYLGRAKRAEDQEGGSK